MSVAVAATTLVALVVVVAVVAAQSVKLPLLFPTPFVHSIMGRASAHSMQVRRGRVLHGSITRSIGPSTADSVREKAAVAAQTPTSRVRSLGADSNCGFCAQELFIVRVDATFFNELEMRKNANSAVAGGQRRDESGKA